MTQRPAGLPSPEQVIELLDDEFARAGYDIEDVAVDDRSRPPRVTVVADGETPLSIDAAAELSRTASALLDSLDTGSYLLEVTSPGVDRPLTEEKHFRRARGRKVEMEMRDATTVTGRIAAVGDGAVDLVVPGSGGPVLRRFALPDIRTAVVQVEFSRPSAAELALVTNEGTEAEA